MDDDQSKRYESIDALIKAAEVLERNESISKNQMTTKDRQRFANFSTQKNFTSYRHSKLKLKYSAEKHLDRQSKERLSDPLLQTIECIRELRNDERWYSLIESKLKSDNRALYHELNVLKRKLKRIKNITSATKKLKSIDKSFEDEDTSTASEDEDYNKYDSKTNGDNVDDATDDASECEEIKQYPNKSKIYQSKQPISKEKVIVVRNLSEDISTHKRTLSTKDDKRKHKAPSCSSPDLLKTHHPSILKHSAMTSPFEMDQLSHAQSPVHQMYPRLTQRPYSHR